MKSWLESFKKGTSGTPSLVSDWKGYASKYADKVSRIPFPTGILCAVTASYFLAQILGRAAALVVAAPLVILMLALFGDIPFNIQSMTDNAKVIAPKMFSGDFRGAFDQAGAQISISDIAANIQKVVTENAYLSMLAIGLVLVLLFVQNVLRYSKMVKSASEGNLPQAFKELLLAWAPTCTILLWHAGILLIVSALKGSALGVALVLAGLVGWIGSSGLVVTKVATIGAIGLYFYVMYAFHTKVIAKLITGGPHLAKSCAILFARAMLFTAYKDEYTLIFRTLKHLACLWGLYAALYVSGIMYGAGAVVFGVVGFVASVIYLGITAAFCSDCKDSALAEADEISAHLTQRYGKLAALPILRRTEDAQETLQVTES